jgi:Fe-S oxidoreductase
MVDRYILGGNHRPFLSISKGFARIFIYGIRVLWSRNPLVFYRFHRLVYTMVLKKLLQKISSIGGNTIYYPGCLTKFAGKDIEENYRKILSSLEIEFITLPEFKCCGSPVLSAGYKKDYDKLVSDNKELFKKYSVNRIITNCPTCAYQFREVYKLDIEVLHTTQVLAANLDKVQPGKHKKERICYHDPCHLGRHSGVYDEPRNILIHLGYEVVELKDHREVSMCCGGGGGLRSNDQEMAQKIAKIRLKQCTADQIVTPCPMCYKQLKDAAKGTKIKVYEFAEVVL